MPRKRTSEPSPVDANASRQRAEPQGPITDLALHTLGWKAFQDLCAQICEEVLKKTVSIYRDAQDGGQDAVFLIHARKGEIKGGTGTVQCKFTSNSQRHLKPSDLNEEKKVIRDLVAKGEADTYILITNMRVDAPVAAVIRESLRELGINEPYVLGKEWITLKIRESSRLRALVPRIYGLGDLSIILDERRAAQTRALLGHLMPALSVYVPTAAHRKAVKVLSDHGIVLLLGAPATGKSTLAAILATMAVDGDRHRCFQVDGPKELMDYWNPHEFGGFYWIDDAFGPNQLRDDYVDEWIAIMNKVKAAIAAGNRFVLTSRSHIWWAAKNKLATRNHPRLADGAAVVDVGSISYEERSQILYNHIKAGNQLAIWKRRVKPYLEVIAKEKGLLPEIARRLGDKSHTAGITKIPEDLRRFVAEPMEFLKDTISELNAPQQAALTLVFLYRSRLPTTSYDDELWALVGDKFGVSQIEMGNALNQLSDSFLALKTDAAGQVWAFAHPTIADALSAILRQRPDLVELYVRGTRIEMLLSEITCVGAKSIQDAIIVPVSVNDLLISRLLDTPDEPTLNRALFGFLGERASEAVLRSVVAQNPTLLARKPPVSWSVWSDPKTRLYARLYALGLLSETLRLEAVEYMENAIFNDLDGSFLDEDDMLALFSPTRLLALSVRLSGELFESLPDRLQEIIDQADISSDPEDCFYYAQTLMTRLEAIFAGSKEVQERIEIAKSDIAAAIDTLKDRKEDSEVEWNGEDIAPRKIMENKGSRSLFSDVDA